MSVDGCPLNCSFCSVTAFNGAHYRQRPIPDVVKEFKSIREKHVLVVDDNLIGTRHEHIARAKDLFRFETPSPEGLLELGKKYNLLKGRDFRASVRRIQRHNILVAGSFIIGLDIDEPGIGKRIRDNVPNS